MRPTQPETRQRELSKLASSDREAQCMHEGGWSWNGKCLGDKWASGELLTYVETRVWRVGKGDDFISSWSGPTKRQVARWLAFTRSGEAKHKPKRTLCAVVAGKIVAGGVPRLQLKTRYPTNNNFAEYHSILNSKYFPWWLLVVMCRFMAYEFFILLLKSNPSWKCWWRRVIRL